MSDVDRKLADLAVAITVFAGTGLAGRTKSGRKFRKYTYIQLSKDIGDSKILDAQRLDIAPSLCLAPIGLFANWSVGASLLYPLA